MCCRSLRYRTKGEMVRIKFVASIMAPDEIQRCPHFLRMYYEDDDL